MKTIHFKYLMMLIVPMAVSINPVYAWQQNDAVKVVSTKPEPENDNENTKPNAYQLFGYGDPKMDSISQQINHYSNKIHNFYNNNAFENLNARAKGFSHPALAFYNNDTLRHLMAQIDKISQYFKARNDREVQLQRDSLGHVIGDYFKTQKFMSMNAALQKKYHIDPSKSYNEGDAGYHQYHAELTKKMPAGIRENLQQLKELSTRWRDQLQSTDYVTYIKQIPVLIDSMKNYYKTSHVEQYSYASYQATMDVPADEKKKAQEELRSYIANPEYKRASEMLNEYAKKMQNYYKTTPAVKDREGAWKSELKTILGDDYDNIVHPAHDLGYLYAN